MRTMFTFLAFVFGITLYHTAWTQNLTAENQKQYSFSDGETSFVLNKPNIRHGKYDATLQMDEGGEIWILHKSQGVGGTVVYKNDIGRVFLRVNLRGGATLYPTPDSRGIPVLQESEFRYESVIDVVPELEVNLASVEDWSRVYEYAGTKTANANDIAPGPTGTIEFSDWPGSQLAYKSSLIDHLIEIKSNGLAQPIDRIVVKIGEEPAAQLANSDLIIWVNPSLGYAGRPSSEKIRVDLKRQKD